MSHVFTFCVYCPYLSARKEMLRNTIEPPRGRAVEESDSFKTPNSAF